jgi:phasin family protein
MEAVVYQISRRNKGEVRMDGSQGKTPDTTTTMVTMTKTTEKITSFTQGNIEAVIQAGQVCTAGCQAISKTMATTAQAHLDQTMSIWKAMMTVRSVSEATNLQASFVQAPFETAFAETGKLADASLKLISETMAPITERITLAVEVLKPSPP